MGRGEIFIDRLTKAADLQDESIPGLPVVELAGDRRVLIERHCGVTEYGRERIRVKVKFGQLCIYGTGLELAKMTKEQLVISGRIQGVEITRGCK